MPNRCVAAGCSNVPDPSKSIGLHKFPEDNDLEKKRRRLWVAFVRTKRAKWSPTATSRLCSQHFKADDFESPFITIPGTTFVSRAVLKKDAIPTIHSDKAEPSNVEHDIVDSRSNREHRSVIRGLLKESVTKTSDEAGEEIMTPCESVALLSEPDLEGGSIHTLEQSFATQEFSTQTPECLGCKNLRGKNRQLRNKIIDLETKIEKQENRIQQQKEDLDTSMSTITSMENIIAEHEEARMASDDEVDAEVDIEEEPQFSEASSEHDMYANPESNSDEYPSESSSDDEEPELPTMESSNSESMRTEPKFIVFLSQLLLLFNTCPTCKSDEPFIETSVIGTMVKVKTQCFNPHCPSPINTWRSQPIMTGTKMAAMNFLLCFSVLVSGASPSKTFLVFRNMGLSCISLKTYFKHQAKKIFPTVHLYWKKYQQGMVEKLKANDVNMVIAGDGRHDSMGHSAKYCAYTLFCCTVPLILDFSLIQRNVAGSSQAMEMVGFKQCMDSLLVSGIIFDTFISDRHSAIAKYMRENLSHIKHYFDLWHLKKS